MKNKREWVYVAVIIGLLVLIGQIYYSGRYEPAHEISVYYNQDHPLNLEVINAVKDADHFVYFAVYTFTRADIQSAILGAKYRGLDVVGITDKSQYEQASGQKQLIDGLRQAGIPVYEQDSSGIMHMKALVTDKEYLSGSYNWTTSATEVNDEVLEVGRDPGIRAQYQNILRELFEKYKDAPQD